MHMYSISVLRSAFRTQLTLSYKSCGIFQESSLSTGPPRAWRAVPRSKLASGLVPGYNEHYFIRAGNQRLGFKKIPSRSVLSWYSRMDGRGG